MVDTLQQEINADNSSGSNPTGAQFDAIRALAAAKGVSLTDLPGADDPGSVVQTAGRTPARAGGDTLEQELAEAQAGQAGEAQTQEQPAAQVQKTPDAKALYDRIAKKDAALQQERARARQMETRLQELERRLQEEDEAWKRDPLQALHRRGLTNTDISKRALDLGGMPEPQDKPKSQLPPEFEEIRRELEAMKQWKQQNEQTIAETRQQQKRQQDVGVLRDHLAKFPEFALLNEMGEHEAVLAAVQTHLNGGQFEDEEEAAEVIAALARKEETRLQTQLRSYLGKPGVRSFLERELRGPQNAAKPARQESKGVTAAPHGGAPQLSNDLAGQRLTRRVEPEDGLTREERMRRAVEEGSSLLRLQQAG